MKKEYIHKDTRTNEPLLQQLQAYNLEYLEAQNSEEIFGGNYTSAIDLKYAKEEIERLNNIINTILEFDFFKNNCPLDFSYTEKCDEDEAQNVFYEDAYCEENCSNEFKKCWLKYFEELQELKGSDKE